MAKILGLDLGTNSIGWALIDDTANKILGIGSRIFPMGVENLGDGDNEISKNASRTGARGVRRQFFRRRLRKKILLKALLKHQFFKMHYSQHPSLETAFTKWMHKEDENVANGLNGFYQYFFSGQESLSSVCF